MTYDWGLETAAQGHIITAIMQYQKLGWTDDEIRGVLEIELKRRTEVETQNRS